MEGFMVRGWGLDIPGRGGTSTLSRGATLARSGSMRASQPFISQWVWGFHTLQDGIVPGDVCFRLRVVEVVYV